MWKIFFHSLVSEKDLVKVDPADKKKIIKAIKTKLTKDPYAFGKPLTKDLKGFLRLRVGDYRVVYRVRDDVVEVFVLHIGARRNLAVYLEAAKRLGLL